MTGVDLKRGDGLAVDEPDMFYECGSEGYVDLGAETIVKEKLREGFEIGDTYFEDSLDPNLGSLDLVVDDLYSLLENQGHHHHTGEIRCMLRMSQEIGSRVDQGGITCGAIDEPKKSSKAIDERVIINFRDKNVIIARFCDKNVVIARFRDKNVYR